MLLFNMKNWIFSFCSILMLTLIINLVLPSKRLSNIIKNVFAVICLSVFISPLFNISNLDINWDSFDISVQTNYLQYIAKAKEQQIIKYCDELLNTYNITNAEYVIELDNNDPNIIKKISIIFDKEVINLDKAHIDIIEEIKNKLSSAFSVEAKDIILWNK